MRNRIDELRSLLRAEPESRRFFQLGDLLRKIGSFDEAEKVFRQGLEHHPRYTAAWISLGRVQLEQKKFQEAESAFTRSLELDPENPVSARLLGDTALAAGESVRAIKAYKLARALGDPELDETIEEVQEAIWASEGGRPNDDPGPPGGIDLSSVGPDTQPEVQLRGGASGEPDVFSLPSEDLAQSSEKPQGPRQVIFVGEDDPFGFEDSREPGSADGDVFSIRAETVEEQAQNAPPADVFGLDETVEDRAKEKLEPAPVESLEKMETEFGIGSVDQSVDQTADNIDEIPEPEFSAGDEEMPVPTLTLARLAWKQGDAALAESTLRLVLLRDPENVGAHELLDEISNAAQAVEEPTPGPDETEEMSLSEVDEDLEMADTDVPTAMSGDELRRKKIAVLHSWASGIRRVSGEMC